MSIVIEFREWLQLLESMSSSEIALKLVDDDKSKLQKLKSIIPSELKEPLRGKFLPIAAYFYREQPNLEILKNDLATYAMLIKRQNIQPILIGDDLKAVGNPTYLSWTAAMHAKQAAKEKESYQVAGDVSGLTSIGQSTDGKIKIYFANRPDLCIMLGKGEKFCISQPGNTQFQSYRDIKTSTFYFVYDGNRPPDDDLAIVVVDINMINGRQSVELTDRKNDTNGTMQDPREMRKKRIASDPVLYFDYLKSKGVDTSIFKNIPKTSVEKAEQSKLGRAKRNTEWFIRLSPDEKSKYIGRGHLLSDEQFDFLFDNKINDLLEQYVKIGRRISKHQIDKIMTKSDLKKKYFHNRMLAQRHILDIGNYEYKVMGKENRKDLVKILKSRKKGDIYHGNEDGDLNRAIVIGNLSLVKLMVETLEFDFFSEEVLKYAIKSGSKKMIDYWLIEQVHVRSDFERGLIQEEKEELTYEAINSGKLEIIEYIVEKYKFPIGEEAIDRAINSEKPSVEVVKYLIEKGAPLSLENLESAWFDRSTRDIADYLDKVWSDRERSGN